MSEVKKDRDYKPHGIISRQQIKPPNEKFSRRSKRFNGQEEKQDVSIKQEDCKEECDSDNECKEKVNIKSRYSTLDADKPTDKSKELKKLQFYGPGPKMAGFNTKETKKSSNKTRGLKLVYEFDPVSIVRSLPFIIDRTSYDKRVIMSLWFSFSRFSWQSTFVIIARGAITRRTCYCATVATTATTLSASCRP